MSQADQTAHSDVGEEALVRVGMICGVPLITPVRTAGNRLIQGALFVGGAGLLEFSAGADRIAFYWTPLVIGAIYLLAAVIDGPRGGYWATALGLTGWGLAVAYSGAVRPPDVDIAGVYLAGVGLAGLAAALLRARDFLVSEAGLALTVVGAGLILALSPRADALVDATTYAIAIAVVGALNIAGGGWQLVGGRSFAGPAEPR